MPDNAIRCKKCGVILVDPRKKKVRSCAHYPLIIEFVDGYSHIGLGTAKSGNYMDSAVIDFNFNSCFKKAIEWVGEE